MGRVNLDTSVGRRRSLKVTWGLLVVLYELKATGEIDGPSCSRIIVYVFWFLYELKATGEIDGPSCSVNIV